MKWQIECGDRRKPSQNRNRPSCAGFASVLNLSESHKQMPTSGFSRGSYGLRMPLVQSYSFQQGYVNPLHALVLRMPDPTFLVQNLWCIYSGLMGAEQLCTRPTNSRTPEIVWNIIGGHAMKPVYACKPFILAESQWGYKFSLTATAISTSVSLSLRCLLTIRAHTCSYDPAGGEDDNLMDIVTRL